MVKHVCVCVYSFTSFLNTWAREMDQTIVDKESRVSKNYTKPTKRDLVDFVKFYRDKSEEEKLLKTQQLQLGEMLRKVTKKESTFWKGKKAFKLYQRQIKSSYFYQHMGLQNGFFKEHSTVGNGMQRFVISKEKQMFFKIQMEPSVPSKNTLADADKGKLQERWQIFSEENKEKLCNLFYRKENIEYVMKNMIEIGSGMRPST